MSLPLFRIAPYDMLGLALALSVLLSACTSLQQPSATGTVLLRGLVQYKVSEFLLENPDRAPRVAEIAAVLGHIASGEATVLELQAEALALVIERQNDMTPQQYLQARILIDVLAQFIMERVGSGAVDGEARVQVREFFAWIEGVANSFRDPRLENLSAPVERAVQGE